MKLAWILLCSLLIWGCSDSAEDGKKKKNNDSENSSQTEAAVNPEDLVEVVGSTYTEYYDAAKTKIKFQGTRDDNEQRHGKWVFYREDGKESSISHYKHGVLHGFSQVKRPNGAFYYHGEYEDGKKIGVWKYYDEKGKFSHEINFDEE
ncbi:MAG: hypothetical protein NXI10_04475 [bacterium]|nr:hypothetical protein [bacterium]